MNKIICPYCGYKMPVFFDEQAICLGISVKCKGRNCGKVFPLCVGNESTELKEKGLESDQFKLNRGIK